MWQSKWLRTGAISDQVMIIIINIIKRLWFLSLLSMSFDLIFYLFTKLFWFTISPPTNPGVAPFQGATTGTGGRIRDVQATGRGARVVAGTAGYCVGCLNVPG